MIRQAAPLRSILTIAGLVIVVLVAANAVDLQFPDHERMLAAGTRGVALGAEVKSQRKRVKVVHPHTGALLRTSNQPATIEAFAYADLYAKVSGYLKKQPVDIGDTVTAGDVIAEIDAPEYQQDLNQAQATLARARTQVTLMKAKVTTAKADAEAAEAEVKQSEAEVVKATANLEFRQKQYERVKELFKLKSIDERLVDEKEKEQEAASGAVLSARAAVLTAQAQAEAAQARIGQATAEVEDATAQVQVASSRVDRAAVFVAYTRIKSPYTGVITRRTKHVGDFIRSAEEGATTPLLSVARVDVMRVVVMVPEAEAAYTERGNPAVVEVDAIADKQFHAKVARISNSEDRTTRSMRTEIDLKNDSGLLRDGMFGRATIDLKNAPNAVTVPSSAVIKHDKKSSVFVVHGGQAHSHPVKTGRDDGIHIEIVSGLTAADEVVQTPGEDLAEGTPVETESSDGKDASHSPGEAGGAGNSRKP